MLVADASGAKPRRVGRRWSANSSSVSGVNPTLNLAWSPEGSRLAYVSQRGGPEDVFVVAADG